MSRSADGLAFIPARGGSKRVPGKNLREVGGRSLIARAIDAARVSELFSEIVVSSDDPAVAATAAAEGATFDARPAALARDEAKVIEVLQEFLRRSAVAPSRMVAVLLPTSVLRESADLVEAFRLFAAARGERGVASVSPFERPANLALAIDDAGRIAPRFPDAYTRSTRSQDHARDYWFNGAVVMHHAAGFLAQHTLVGDHPCALVIPLERSVDVDYEYQLRFAEYLLTHPHRTVP